MWSKAENGLVQPSKQGRTSPLIILRKREISRDFARKQKKNRDSYESRFCVATKKLIENEPTSKQQFLGWIFDFCGVSHSKNGVSAVEWGVPLRKSGVSEKFQEIFDLKLLFLHPLENHEVLRIRSGANPKKSLFRMSKI